MVQTNVSLKLYNTFGIDVTAERFVHAKSLSDLEKGLDLFKDKNPLILSGGSNIVLTVNPTHVILIDFKGIEVIEHGTSDVVVRVQAGEMWHDFVLWAIEHDFGGIENLSLIPGKVGAAPIQNIGAYGVTLSDTFESCNIIDVSSFKKKSLSKINCRFGYRHSIFKQELKNKCIITDVTFRLSKPKHHKINTSYGSLQSFLEIQNIKHPTIKEVSDAVINIRKSKLPDPKTIGNSGSFFKNTVVNPNRFEKLLKQFPDVPYIPTEDGFKIPSAWLIESCGFKGYRTGDAGVHDKQALVLVNHGKASGKDILELAQQITEEVKSKFGLTLEREVMAV